MNKFVAAGIACLVLAWSPSLADDAKPIALRLREPTVPFARAMGATAAVFVADVMPGNREATTWAAVLARFDLPFGAR
jgi:hypothetical protein